MQKNYSLMMPNDYEPHGEVPTRLWLLLPIRLYIGVYLIFASIDKVREGMLSTPTLLSEKITAIVDLPGYSHSLYANIYHALIEPNIGVFVFLVIFGELLVGLAIATGTLVRPACLAGLFMLLNFFLAFDKSLMMPDNSTSFAACMIVLFLTSAGRAYGTDHYLRGKLPSGIV